MVPEASPGHLERSIDKRLAGSLSVLVVAALLIVVPFLGPDSIRLGPAFSWPAFILQAAGVAAVAGVWIAPQLAGAVLVLFVYLNVSQVLVSQHDLPSSLRLLGLLLLITAWRGRRGEAWLQAAVSPLTLLLGLYVLLLLISSTVARNVGLADDRWLEVAKATAIVLLFVTVVSTRESVRWATWAMAGAAALLSSLGIFQYLSGSFDNPFWGFARVKQAHIVDDVMQARIAGPLGDPNFFAQILVMALPLALALAWNERTRGLRALALLGAGAILTAIVLTYSRGAGLAMACQGLLLWATSRRRLRVAVLAALAGLVLLIVLPANFTRRLTTIQELMPGEQTVLDPDSSFEERKLYTQTAWHMFVDRPLLGVGAGNYEEYFDEYAERVGSAVRFQSISRTRYPHSLYLEIAAETGILGLLLFLAIVVTSFLFLERSRWWFLREGDPLMGAVAQALQIALVGYLVTSLFLHGHFLRYLWLLFAFAATLDLIAMKSMAHQGDVMGQTEDKSSWL